MRKGVFYDLSDYNIQEDGTIVNRHNNHIVKPQVNGKGYVRVSIGGKLQFVHRLVAEKYLPNPENKLQVNHKDGNKLNNAVSNLEWVTNQENRDHTIKNNLHLSGERCPWAKLTRENVNYIRAHHELSDQELANKYGVSIYGIRDVRNGHSWKD